jgi:hypothetical protein
MTATLLVCGLGLGVLFLVLALWDWVATMARAIAFEREMWRLRQEARPRWSPRWRRRRITKK